MTKLINRLKLAENKTLFGKAMCFVGIILLTLNTIDVYAQTRVSSGLQALYSFENGAGTTISDVSGVGSALNLTIGDLGDVNWISGGGLSVTSEASISGGVASKLNTAITANNAITLEAWVRPANTSQSGPARIITYSESSAARNFTLGQNNDVYQTRLRTTITSDNGTPATETASGSLTTGLQHVVYTRNSSGTTTVYIDGTAVTSGSTTGNLSNWNSSAVFELANEVGGGRAWLGDFYLVAVYDTDLSAGEVSQNYDAGPGVMASIPQIISSAIQSATVNQVYSYNVDASGVPLATYSLSTSPAGMTINTTSGEILWTPTTTGNFNVTVVATNASGSDNQLFTITVNPAIAAGPNFNIWYGDSQDFGTQGTPQKWVNILGNVSDITFTISSLSFTLNGGASSSLTIGPDNRRVHGNGDFNVEIDAADLNNGSNSIIITAQNSNGDITNKTVTINYDNTTTWPLPYDVYWSETAQLSDAVQIVDGQWEITADGLHSAATGYDRAVVFGQRTWTDYEILFPVTINALNTNGYLNSEGGGVLGMSVTMRGQGHSDDPVVCPQPHCGWNPIGASLWYEWRPSADDRIRITDANPPAGDVNTIGLQFEVGKTYWFLARIESTPSAPSGGALYSFKTWENGTAEPAGWTVEKQTNDGGATAGGVGLAAHFVDVTIGDVTINEVDASAPRITSAPDELVTEGEAYSYLLESTANPSATYALLTGPASMSINSSTGQVDWANPTVGSHLITATASNSEGTDTQLYILEVTSVGLAVEWTSFTGLQDSENNIRLGWSVSDDGNTSFYTIQQSVESQWVGLAEISAGGKPAFEFTTEKMPFGLHRFRIKSTDIDGAVSYSETLTVNVEGPTEMTLSAPWPNPFTSQTQIELYLPVVSKVQVEIYNVLGQKVRSLLDGMQPEGTHQVILNADDLPAGVYFIQASYKNQRQIRKVLVVK